MGHYGTLRDGIVGEVSSTATNIIRTFVAKVDIAFGQPIQLDRSEAPDSRYVIPFNPTLVGEIEPVLGVSVRDSLIEGGVYKAGQSIAVMTYGDIRVQAEINDMIANGTQVLLDNIGTTDPTKSPYAFADTQTLNIGAYGIFIDGGRSTATKTHRIAFDTFKVLVTA